METDASPTRVQPGGAEAEALLIEISHQISRAVPTSISNPFHREAAQVTGRQAAQPEILHALEAEGQALGTDEVVRTERDGDRLLLSVLGHLVLDHDAHQAHEPVEISDNGVVHVGHLHIMPIGAR